LSVRSVSPCLRLCLFTLRPPTCSTLFPYTTLFRSCSARVAAPSAFRPQVSISGNPLGRGRPNRTATGRAFLPTPASRRGLPASRSEEHTSELQSRENLVCRLLLEKKKTAI